jgi:hypothetical protein
MALIRVHPTSVISCVLSLHECSRTRFFETSCIPTGVFSRCLVHSSAFLLLSAIFTRVLSWHIIFAYAQLFCVGIYNITDVRSITNCKSGRTKQINLFYSTIRYSPLRVYKNCDSVSISDNRAQYRDCQMPTVGLNVNMVRHLSNLESIKTIPIPVTRVVIHRAR